jgi:DNA-binding Lrp family transcriptional regulator
MKSQDILVLIKIFLWGKESWSIEKIADAIKISKSETHAAIKRCENAGLLDAVTKRPRKAALKEFLIHGIKYAFPAKVGSKTRGIPTAHSAPPMSDLIESGEDDIYVWPYELGNKRGISIEPLYKSVPYAVLEDKELYEYLALIDCIRIGRVRERKIASDELIKRIQEKNK